MGRRKQHDVFVLGDELLAAEASRPDPELEPGEDQEPDGHPQPSGLGPLPPPRSRLGRRAALIGLAGGAATTVAVVASSLGGSSEPPGQLTSSPHSALVQRPAPRAAAPPAPPARPLPDHRRPESSHGALAAARPQSTRPEPERKPTPSQAPESSPLPIASPPAPEVPQPAPTPASPPPPPSGGGPGGTEHFGFER